MEKKLNGPKKKSENQITIINRLCQSDLSKYQLFLGSESMGN